MLKTIPARTSLLCEGEVARFMYFVKQGCLRLWFNKDGKDVTFQFFMEGQAVSSIESFLGGADRPWSLQSQADAVVEQDGETFLGKRRAQDVVQEAGAGLVVEGTSVGLRVYVESAILHHELADDLGLATGGEEHGGAFALGGACGR